MKIFVLSHFLYYLWDVAFVGFKGVHEWHKQHQILIFIFTLFHFPVVNFIKICYRQNVIDIGFWIASARLKYLFLRIFQNDKVWWIPTELNNIFFFQAWKTTLKSLWTQFWLGLVFKLVDDGIHQGRMWHRIYHNFKFGIYHFQKF